MQTLCSPVILIVSLRPFTLLWDVPKRKFWRNVSVILIPDLELTVLVEYLKDERIPELLNSANLILW